MPRLRVALKGSWQMLRCCHLIKTSKFAAERVYSFSFSLFSLLLFDSLNTVYGAIEPIQSFAEGVTNYSSLSLCV